VIYLRISGPGGKKHVTKHQPLFILFCIAQKKNQKSLGLPKLLFFIFFLSKKRNKKDTSRGGIFDSSLDRNQNRYKKWGVVTHSS